jgi:hypothetical protein
VPKPQQNPDERALARAVGPDEPDDARLDRDGQVVEREDAAAARIAEGERLRRDDSHGRRVYPSGERGERRRRDGSATTRRFRGKGRPTVRRPAGRRRSAVPDAVPDRDRLEGDRVLDGCEAANAASSTSSTRSITKTQVSPCWVAA